jgi:hypothetical protein
MWTFQVKRVWDITKFFKMNYGMMKNAQRLVEHNRDGQVLTVTQEKIFDLGSAGGCCRGNTWTLSKTQDIMHNVAF